MFITMLRGWNVNKEEMKVKFEKNVEFLQRNIPADDIYIFAEQTFMAAMFFLQKWGEWVNISDQCKDNAVVNKWVNNIVGLHVCKEGDLDISLDLDLKSLEPDENNY